MTANRRRHGRVTSMMGAAAVLWVALSAASCGGGGGGGSFAAKPMALVEFLFVDRALVPSFPTGAQALPRNAQIIFQFSELVDPRSVDSQTIALRYGPQLSYVPKGSYQIDGSRVVFDPTVTSQGTPNPFGFAPVTQFVITIPAVGDAGSVVMNRDHDPITTSFFSTFTTGEGYLRELDPPQVKGITFLPGRDAVTGNVPGNATLAVEFSEPMDPASFVLAIGATVEEQDTVSIRYDDLPPYPNVNTTNGVAGSPILGAFSPDSAATTYYFVPVFSWGDKKYTFTVELFQGLADLSGNLLVNPRSFGPFTCDGTGIATGKLLSESFDTTTDRDPATTTADWGFTIPGELDGAPITSSTSYIAGYQFAEANQGGYGEYAKVVDPLTGAQLNNIVTNVIPATSEGRRTLWSFKDTEIGAGGTITSVLWGPDSNVTFAARYPNVILRLGFQRAASLALSDSFSGNYRGTPLVVYQGVYSVQQSADVGNAFTPPTRSLGVPASLQPLYDYTGYVPWPALTSFFDWDPGDPTVAEDSILIFDASIQEGDTFQRFRRWSAVTGPGSPTLIAGFAARRLSSTYEADTPNPPSNVAARIWNPEPSITDTAFVLAKRISIAQSRFYTPSSVDLAGNAYPNPLSSQTTFGVKTQYLPAIVTPSIQEGGASLLVEYQGAIALDPTSNRTRPSTSFPTTAFTTTVADCDGFPYVRWRITLVSNLTSNKVAKVSSVVLPILQSP